MISHENCAAINKEKTGSILNGMLSVKPLSLGFGSNSGEVAEVVVFSAIGDGFQIFGITTVGDADNGDLALLCHIYRLLFFYNGIIGKLIPSNSAALFHKTDNTLCVGICLRNPIQGLLGKFLLKVVFVHIHRSFEIVFASRYRIFGFTNWRIMWYNTNK